MMQLDIEIEALKAEVASLRADNERLRAENFSLAAWQCEFTDGKTGLVAHEHGGTYCAMAKENERLRAANETWASAYHAEYYANVELREVLRDIHMTTRCDKTAAKARAALAAQPTGEKHE